MTLPSHDAAPIPAAARAEIERLLASGDLFRYTAPQDAPAARLEAEFAALMGAKYALAVSSCSAALFLALKALDMPRGARVLVPAFTFAAVPSAVLHAEAAPVLVEVGNDLRLDMEDFAAKLPGAAAVLVSHMRGHTSDMDRIMGLADAAGVPVVEDAAHSLGTLWGGRPIGTLGRIGCFSFQSYKMINAGEGGMLITDDAELAARATIMSGAYEHNWRKHSPAAAGPRPDADMRLLRDDDARLPRDADALLPRDADARLLRDADARLLRDADARVLRDACIRWQNRLPLYNARLSNLAAAVVRPQLPELARRVRDGRRNHDLIAARLDESPWLTVPAALPREQRAPDSIQFLLSGMTDAQVTAFVAEAGARGAQVQVFGMSSDNARAFWNWGFLEVLPELPKTRAMLRRTCDLRLPVHLSAADCAAIADTLIAAAAAVMARPAAYGT